MNIEQDLLAFIKKQLARPEFDLQPDTNLVGIVDSTGVIELVVYITDHYGFEVEIDAITPENFGTVRKLTEYIKANAPRS